MFDVLRDLFLFSSVYRWGVNVMATPEANFQRKFCDWLEDNGFKWIRNKANGTTRLGIPDISVFYKQFWAWLEFKASAKSKARPGQKQNVEWAQNNSYGDFVCPEDAEFVKQTLLYFKNNEDIKSVRDRL